MCMTIFTQGSVFINLDESLQYTQISHQERHHVHKSVQICSAAQQNIKTSKMNNLTHLKTFLSRGSCIFRIWLKNKQIFLIKIGILVFFFLQKIFTWWKTCFSSGEKQVAFSLLKAETGHIQVKFTLFLYTMTPTLRSVYVSTQDR